MNKIITDSAGCCKIPASFDPATAPDLKIVSCQNGWALYSGAGRLMDHCFYAPQHVFSSPVELAKAVANLVQFGTVERPTTWGLGSLERRPTRESFGPGTLEK